MEYEDPDADLIISIEELGLTDEEADQLQEIINLHDAISEKYLRIHYYHQYKQLYFDTINDLLSDFDLDLVVYDEQETFPSHDHELYDYPFMPRKQVIDSFEFDYHPMEDYSFSKKTLQF